MMGLNSDLNSARGNHISGNPPATAAEARNVQASNSSISSNQLNLVTLEKSTAESSSLSSTSPIGVRTKEEQAMTQLANSTGVVPEQTPMLSKSANEASTSRPVQDVLRPTEQALDVSKLSKIARRRKNKRLKRLDSGPASVLSTDKKADNIVDDGSLFSVVSGNVASKGVTKSQYINKLGTTGFRNEDKYSMFGYSGVNRPCAKKRVL